MSDIVRIDESNIVDFLHNSGGLDIAKPFEQHIYLVDARIAGTTYVDGIREIEPRLAVDTRLNFFREPNNPHDPLAILIKDAEGNKLGYVPRRKNEILSRLMDAGKLLYGTIYEKEFVGDWLKITIRIYLND